MIAITDTHTLLWHDARSPRASAALTLYLRDPAWTVYLSVINPWEMQIKARTGKLALRADVGTIIADQLRQYPFRLLPVTFHNVLALDGLPSPHRDPFDRMLAAQAVAENAVLLTDDPVFAKYPVRTDW